MYIIKNKVITTNAEERNNMKRSASVVIYGELIRYITIKRANARKTA